MVTALELEEIVCDARLRTGVPGVAAGLWHDGRTVLTAAGVREQGRKEPVLPATPFRIASISKPFTATLASACLALDADVRAFLSHTAGLRCESAQPLPPGAEGLWSYSNAGYWRVGELCAAACRTPLEAAMRARVLEPLRLAATGYDEPPGAARGHVQEGESGHRPVPVDAYPVERRASGGLWSTVADLLRFAAHHLAGRGELFAPHAEALGAAYCLGWWRRELAGGRTAYDHEGSVAGYQSLLLLVPEEALALALLTNSWRGSGLIRRVVEALGFPPGTSLLRGGEGVAGTYALDGAVAEVRATRGGIRVVERESDPVTGAAAVTRYPARPLGNGVYGLAHGTLMTHRLDFPRPGLARIGWVVLPRVSAGA